jgi:hypothetical protein
MLVQPNIRYPVFRSAEYPALTVPVSGASLTIFAGKGKIADRDLIWLLDRLNQNLDQPMVYRYW